MLIEAFVFGQNNGSFKYIDTLKVIQTRNLLDNKITYNTETCEYQFSKAISIMAIDNLLKELEKELEINSTQGYKYEKTLRYINDYKVVRDYLFEQNYLKLNKPLLDDTITNNLQLTCLLFGYVLPKMLDSGMFKLFLNGKEQTIITKIDAADGYEASISYSRK